jgi:hypothetical protein
MCLSKSTKRNGYMLANYTLWMLHTEGAYIRKNQRTQNTKEFFWRFFMYFANLACFASIVTTMREKYAAISARKIFSHIFHSFSLLSLFLFVSDKCCHFLSLTWCFCFHNTFILSKSDEFSLNWLFHDLLNNFQNLSSIAVNKEDKFDTVSKDS